MKSLSNLGLGLSLVFGCLLLALVAELYYLLWWKKRIFNREIEDDYSSSPKHLLYLLCWKKPPPLGSRALNTHPSHDHGHPTDGHSRQMQQSNDDIDFLLKPNGEESVEAEIMRLHNMCGPPRFLFTIKEETKEDLESEDGKSRADNKSKKGSRSRSLSDILVSMETPFLTPLSSPPFLTPPLTPLDCCHQHGFNPLFESSTDADLFKATRSSSPPPKLKFLRDAEEKASRKPAAEGAKNPRNSGAAGDSCCMGSSEGDGSFITIIIGKSKDRDVGPHQHHANSSQVLPLDSSPTNVRLSDQKLMLH